MKKHRLSGVGAAMITPFKSDFSCDYDTLGRMIDYVIDGGTDYIVALGTTAETPTLSHEERNEVFRYIRERVAGRTPIVLGAGGNDTVRLIEQIQAMDLEGVDALLSVTPYYNKATQKGLIKSFFAVADATDKPIILYNVPSRTGCNITLPVYKELAKHERIVAVKEASGNMSAIAELIAECGDSLDVYSGNDDQIVPIMSLGGKGVISVLSNLYPKETHDMARLCLKNNYTDAAKLQLSYLKLINALFCEVNPVPVKTAMAEMGLCDIEMRLPLCEMDDANKAKLVSIMKDYKLL